MGLFGLGSGSMGKGANSQVPDFSKAYIANGDDGKPYVKDPAKLWREVIELRDDSLSNRKPHERMWALCWMFYKGDQWRKPAPAPDWNIIRINVGRKPKITINKILPMVQTRRAHVLKNRPTGVVMPRTLDEEDRNASRVAQDVLNYDQQHLKNWEILDGKLSLGMFVTGNAFKKIYFDPTKGDKKEHNKYQLDPETGAPVTVPDFQGHGGSPEEDMQNPAIPFASSDMGMAGTSAGPASEKSPRPEEPDHTQNNLNQTDTGLTFGEKPILEGTEEEPEGDVVIEYVPPEEILPEPAATSLDDCQRLLHRTLKPLKWVKDTFGTSAEDVEPINVKSEKGKATVNGAKMFGMTEREVANRVEVLEAWFRPSTEYPDGLHAVWADDKLMAAGPTPEAHEAIPFVHYVEIETDEFWGISSVSQVIDPQKALNLAISRDEFMRQRLRPKLMAPTESGLDESAYSNDDSEIVYYNHPFIPKFTEPPAFERDEKAVGFFKEAVDDIGGSADVMRGQIQGGSDIRSGRMVNYLQEYAGTVLAGPARSIERGEERTGNLILRLRKHYTTEPKIYYIVGRNRNVEVKQFIGSDIEGASDYVVQAGSALPMSMAEKRDMVLSLVEKGILPPGDPRIIKMLGMPSDVDEMFNEDQLDRDNATEEDHKFLAMTEETAGGVYGTLLDFQNQTAPGAAEIAGIKPTPGQVLDSLDLSPKDFENHIVHLETHNRSRKSKAYKQLPKAVQALYDEHCDMHAMFLLPPPAAPGAEPGGPGGGGANKPPGKEGPDKKNQGGPAALNGGQPPGPGGAGNVNAQGNQERSESMPPTRSPPGANNHHLR